MKRLNLLDKGITVQSSKCSHTLIISSQRRASDQLEQNFHHTGELVSTHNRFASNLPFQHVGNLVQFVVNFWCNFCAFRPTWRPNDTELKISDCARHTWPSNVTVKKSTADRQWERWRKAREGLWICANGCMYGYGQRNNRWNYPEYLCHWMYGNCSDIFQSL